MKKTSLRNKLTNAAAAASVILFAAMPTYANAHNIVFDLSQYDENQFSQDHYQCENMLSNVGNNEGQGAVEQGVKRGLRGATAGAIAGSVSGNSGSSAAKTGAAIGTTVGVLSGRGSKNAAASANQKERDDLMRNCMQGRGYIALN
ncbi:glycine zipper family protein [uncultured Vibrio sp.]|mgnify:CR=1 FL=1|uniref:glycine zipper family protein n=1 Tax=uncultured Vibrio sp. TaxID=114054 RepID=UPI000913F34A|nr:glycine zipper family protein [uncultured Vibrio sp.]OIQ26451.1 MAG: glycine zipper family protein [Vibrio sp. MedPE-SWchi]